MVLGMDEQDRFFDGVAVTFCRHHGGLDVMGLTDFLAGLFNLLARFFNIVVFSEILNGLDDPCRNAGSAASTVLLFFHP